MTTEAEILEFHLAGQCRAAEFLRAVLAKRAAQKFAAEPVRITAMTPLDEHAPEDEERTYIPAPGSMTSGGFA